MEKELYNWLQTQFNKDNIKKYHKYFDDWISNVTTEQIIGFEQQMIGMITKNKQQH